MFLTLLATLVISDNVSYKTEHPFHRANCEYDSLIPLVHRVNILLQNKPREVNRLFYSTFNVRFVRVLRWEVYPLLSNRVLSENVSCLSLMFAFNAFHKNFWFANLSLFFFSYHLG